MGGQGWLGLSFPSFYNVRSRPIQIPGYGLLALNQSYTPQQEWHVSLPETNVHDKLP